MTGKIIGAAIEVHRVLGPGLLESVYEECLERELRSAGLAVARQVALPLLCKGEKLEATSRFDLVVESQVVVELKTVAAIEPVHKAQLLSYMRLSGMRTGLLINFNVSVLRDGIVRMVL